MDKNDSCSVLVLSKSGLRWVDLLSKQQWPFQVSASLEVINERLKQHSYQLIIVDLSDRAYAYQLLQSLTAASRHARVIAYLDKAQYQSLGVCEQKLIARHCVDFYTSPLPEEQILTTIGHQIGILHLHRDELDTSASDKLSDDGLIGRSAPMTSIKRQIDRIAPRDVNVLILGESGTGKELIAKSIHRSSLRAEHPFVAVNCGALSETLIHSELFGHVKGAFTGANDNKPGKIALADKGTLFLDEIGDLPLSMQANLLRFLQEGTVDVLGSKQPRKVDVRVLAATHVNLEQAVALGKFREDLYYRLNVISIRSPSLRERGEDISQLGEYFTQQFSSEYFKQSYTLSSCAMRGIQHYPWPGNVRELMNVVKRAVLLGEGPVLMLSDLELPMEQIQNQRVLTEKEELMAALEKAEGKVIDAARHLGVSRATIYRLLNKHDLVEKLHHYRGQWNVIH